MSAPRTDACERTLLAPGELIDDRFRVEACAAVGGMGVVYRATDLTSEQPVAIKVIARRTPLGEARFASEVALLAELSHPMIVRYIAHGVTAQQCAYLAMEWLHGEDLATRLGREGLRPSEALTLLRALCMGLAAAHARGIVHRDIKPSNVFLVDGAVTAVKLLDFGVARREAAPRARTRAGALLGTVGYMAPEQARGARDLDARADVFALGCVLFECLTGQPAFSGAHDIAVLAKVLRDEPPAVSQLRPRLGDALDAPVARLLAKDRAQRPQDAGAVLALLAEISLDPGAFDEAADVAPEPREIDAEQRIASVILGVPPGDVGAHDAGWADADVEALAQRFDAEAVAMQGGAFLLTLSAASSSAPTDQAVQAARCALSLSALRPTLAIGVATGAVDTTGRVPVGVAIDRAAALLVAAERTVRVDRLTADLLRTRFVVRRAPDGLVLAGERDECDDADVLMGKSTPFVGRTTEIALLHATLRECIDDQVARAVLITAPAGAGKSRIGREFLEGVRATPGPSVRVLRAGADPTSAGSSLSLVQRLLRSAVGIRAGEPIALQRQQLAAHLRARMRPEVRDQTFDFLSEILGVGSEAPERALHRAARSDPEVMREQKRRAFEAWLSAELDRGPVVLFLEDLHWGDLPSVGYVQELVQTLAHRPLLVLVTARPEVHAQFPRLRGAHGFDEVSLRALTRRASEQLARAMLAVDTPAAVIDKVVTLASGNAFYLEELVRRVAEGGDAELPETVVAMAQSRLERLPSDARRVLRAASIFGETAWTGGVDCLLGASVEPSLAHATARFDSSLARGSARFDAQALCAWLSEHEILQQRLDPRFPSEREYVFRHALLREAAYAMLTEGDRRAGHLRAAEWLEARGERDARVLADHFERGGAVARAIPWIVRAATAALDGGDLESAIALSQRGAGLGAYGDQRGMLLLVRAYALVWRAKCDLALPREALTLLPRASAPWWLALSVHVFGSLLLGQPELAEASLQLALTTSPDDELTGAYGQAIHTLAAGSALIGRAHVGWALVHHLERELEARASAASRKRGDPGFDDAFLAWLSLTKCILASNSLMESGRWELGTALRAGCESIDAMRVLGSAYGESAALFHFGNALWLTGSYAQASSMLQQSLTLARQTGHVLTEQHAALLLAVAALRGGSRREALATLQSLTASSNAQVAHGAEVVIADSRLREGAVDEAIARARAAVTGASLLYRRMAASTLARGYLARGEPAAALAAVDRALADGARAAFPNFTIDLLGSRARALIARGAHDEAARVVAVAWRFREDTASRIDEPEWRESFRSRGQPNRVLDALSAGGVVQDRLT